MFLAEFCLLRNTRVIETSDPVNYRWEDGRSCASDVPTRYNGMVAVGNASCDCEPPSSTSVPVPEHMQPIIPIIRKEPFDGDGWLFELKLDGFDPAWLFELKLDGFRGIANTVRGRMLSKNLNPLKRFRHLLDALPAGYVFDGEIVALDEDGRPRFNDLLFRRREPSYVAFDVLFVDGEDVRAAPLKERKALLEKVVRRHRMQKSEPVLGEGIAAFRAVCGLDLEGIVAKRLADSYAPRTKWWKILNQNYSQKVGRAELFERRTV